MHKCNNEGKSSLAGKSLYLKTLHSAIHFVTLCKKFNTNLLIFFILYLTDCKTMLTLNYTSIVHSYISIFLYSFYLSIQVQYIF